jgi:hypothetical protein
MLSSCQGRKAASIRLVHWDHQIQKECAEIPKSPNNHRSDWATTYRQAGTLREMGPPAQPLSNSRISAHESTAF